MDLMGCYLQNFVTCNMISLEDIEKIGKNTEGKGYVIEFKDGKKIHLTKRRTIIALLILLNYGEGTEADLAKGSTKIPEIREILEGKIPENYIQDYYGDANKPYSELWNEEGFTWIDNLKGGRKERSQKYVLKPEDHDRLFNVVKKANLSSSPTEQPYKSRIFSGKFYL